MQHPCTYIAQAANAFWHCLTLLYAQELGRVAGMAKLLIAIILFIARVNVDES